MCVDAKRVGIGVVLAAYPLGARVPPSVFFSHPENRNRSADIHPVILSGGLNLSTDEIADKARLIGYKIVTPCRMTAQKGVDCKIPPDGDSVNLVSFNPHHLPLWRNQHPFCVDSESHIDGYWRGTIVETGKHKFYDRTSSDPFGVVLRSCTPGIVHDIGQVCVDGFFQGSCGIHGILSSAYGDDGLRPYIELLLQSERATDSSRSCKDKRSYATYFAPVRQSDAIYAGLGAIGSNNYRVVSDKRNHRASISQLQGKEHKQYRGPKLLRRHDRWSVALEIDRETREHVEIISGDDLDVGYDGKKWFHLFEPPCLRREEPFYR